MIGIGQMLEQSQKVGNTLDLVCYLRVVHLLDSLDHGGDGP
jgi:hypothetical protein